MFGFVLRNHKKGLVFDGEMKLLDTCLESKTALQRRNARPDNFKLSTYEGNIYGRKQKYVLPQSASLLKEADEKITTEFIEFLIHQAKVKLISDIALGIWLELLSNFDVYKTSGGFVYILALGEREKNMIKRDIDTEAKYILMKEFMDGYAYFDKYEFKQGGKKYPIEISHNYNIGDITIPYNYTLALRKAMFGANQGQNIGPSKLLMDWQYDVIRRMAKITTVFGPRRAGKTFVLAFIARREIMAQKLNFQNQYRPVSVIYLGLSDKKNFKVVQYLKGMDRMFSQNAEGMFHYSDAQKMYSFKSGKEILGSINFISAEQKDPGIGDYADLIIIDEAIKVSKDIREGLEPIIKNEGARLLTASTLYYNAPKNRNYDLMLEAERFSMGKDIYAHIDIRWKKFEHLTKREWDDEDKKEYQKLVNEFSESNPRAGLRYTIDDVEYIPQARRERIKEDMRNKNPQRYYAELYSRYADEGKVFNYNGCLKEVTKDKSKSYKHITTVHDSALTYDKSAVLVGAWDDTLRKVVVLEEHELKKTGYYEDQAADIKQIISGSIKYTQPQDMTVGSAPVRNQNSSDTFFICDGNQKATAELFQMAGINIDLRMTYNARGEHESKSKVIYNEISVPKSTLIEVAEKMIENGFINIDTKLKKLIEEFDTYTKITDVGSGKVKYVKGKSDDFIHAFMMLCYFFYEKLNLKHELIKRTDAKSIGGIDKKAILQIKYQEHRDKLQKQDREINEKLDQIYFYNHVY